jgi:hypothetical protein
MESTIFDSAKPPRPGAYANPDVLDGQWVAEGDIHALNVCDRRPGDRDTVPQFSEEAYIIAAEPKRAPVSRRILETGLTVRTEPKEYVDRKRCRWVSSEPFAVLVTQHSRLSDGDARKKGLVTGQGSLRIFWSKQHHKDGEFERYIPTPSLPLVVGLGPNGEEWKWINLSELAHIAGLVPYDIAPGFLSLKIFSADSTQPSFAAAEDKVALAMNVFQPYPSVKLPPGAVRTSFLAATHDASKDVPPENVWVAAASAEKVLRIASLGVKSRLALMPTRFVNEPVET